MTTTVRPGRVCSLLVLIASLFGTSLFADNVPQPLPFVQRWADTSQIFADDNWSKVPGIIGYRGDGLASSTAVNPQTILGEGSSPVVDVNANLTKPDTFTTGGVAEFELTDPVVALQGSGTARAPYILIHINTSGKTNINVAYSVRDVDGSADNAVQPVALQYRIGATGNFTNLPAGFLADATTGATATQVTNVSVTLPTAADNQPLVEIRMITSDAAGSDEWVGIDDIVITASGPTGTGSATPSAVAAGGSTLLTVAVTPAPGAPANTTHSVSADLSPIGGSSTQQFFDDASHGDVTANDNVFSFSATVAANTTGGAKTILAKIADSLSQNGSATIALNVLASTNPTGTGSASPSSLQPGDSTTLTVNVTPGTNPDSTFVSVTADLSSIGGSSTTTLLGNGNNTVALQYTIPAATLAGSRTLPVSITDGQSRHGNASISLNIEQPPPPLDHVVISQVYGGGGNSNATYQNDFVELYNAGTSTFDLAGWTLQYASAAGTSWTNIQPLGGLIAPGEYFLISLATGGNAGAPLLAANISGEINMSGTAGKIALVRNGEALQGPCPTSDADLVDLVGYGSTATCREGTNNAPAPSNTTAIFRRSGGAIDTNQNATDFTAGTPNPRRTAPIMEIGPSVFNTDPITNGANAPRDASITVNFTEAVDVTGSWFDITCTNTGAHNSATVASAPDKGTYVITPNVNFQSGETCTVTVFKDFVHDADFDDSAANTDALPANYTFSFTTSTGTAPPYSANEHVHLTMGNPSNAVADEFRSPNNFLMEKPEFAVSYNRDRGTPNWVSWHLSDEWTGTLTRVDSFRPDPAVPPSWYRVEAFDYFASGFDRGHMTPNADRDKETSMPINQATFLMSNMIPQAPDNNQGPWAAFENFLRTLTPANELYIVAGPAGVGGTGSSGFATTIANGHLTVPASTWKVVLVIPKASGNDVARVTGATRTIAVLMPNIQGIRNNDWSNYIVSIDQVEALTGYDFFANLDDKVENAIEAGVNGLNPPGVVNQSASTNEDEPVSFTLTATAGTSTNPLTFTITSNPQHGTLSGAGNSRTYTPAPDFNGTDTFTFVASDGALNSTAATVTLNVRAVNDLPVISAIPNQLVFLGNTLTFDAHATDVDGPQPHLGYALSGSVPGGAAIDAAGHFAWTPTGGDAGLSFTFNVVVSDGVASVSTPVTINVVDNTAPVLSPLTLSLTQLWPVNHKLVDITVSYNVTDLGDTAPVCSLRVSSNETPAQSDWEIVDAHNIRLRAERLGTGDGRVYTVSADCADRFGNIGHGSAIVTVPKNQGNN